MKANIGLTWMTVAVINVLLTFYIWSSAFRRASIHVGRAEVGNGSVQHTYTYIDDDYPKFYPVSTGPLQDVAMTLYDSIHFSVDYHPYGHFNVSSALAEADDEWNLLGYIPTSYGRVRLGPENRIFLITTFHLTHCLQGFYSALSGVSDPTTQIYHMNHCLNYYRQWALCSANVGLEEGDFMDTVFNDEDAELLPLEERAERRSRYEDADQFLHGNWHPGRIRGELVCKDWDALYRDLELNWEKWLDWKQEWN